MARPIKEGLDYFPLDVDIDQDDKIALIEASHGLVGFAVIIKVLMKIYDNSYFYEWGEKEQLLFSRRVNVNINEVNVIIDDCIKWGIFSAQQYEKHQILTSAGIQRRYLEAASRRKRVSIWTEYLLLDEKEVKSYKNLVVVDINSIDDDISTQRKVEESKVKESKEKVEEKGGHQPPPSTTTDAIVFYQNNFGPITPHISDDMLIWINDMGDEIVMEAMIRAIERNKKSWGYVKGILQSWLSKNIKTMDQIKAEDIERQNQIQQRQGAYQNNLKSLEVVPDWFKNRYQTAPKATRDDMTDEEKKKMAEMLRKMAAD